MTIYPGAEHRPLGRQSEPRLYNHDIICFHTMVGGLSGTDAYFKQDGYYGVESHFGIGGSTDGAADGKVNQWQDLDYQADANLDGKPYVISIETSDGANPDRSWSPKQLDALVDLGVWLCKRYNIPPVLVRDTKAGTRGLAYHRQGCTHGSSYRARGWPYDQWLQPGGLRWSTVTGKTCPGDVRIKQLVDVVIPRIKAGVEGDDMPSAKEIVDEFLSRDIYELPFKHPENQHLRFKYYMEFLGRHARGAHGAANAARKAVAGLAGEVAALKEAQRQHNAGGSIDYAKVRQAAEAGAKAALETSVVDVDITVNDKTGEQA